MMGAAQAAFNLGYVDAAVNTAICSEAHNYLTQTRDLIIAWFVSRQIARHDAQLGKR
jgi:hypothetical protein